MILSPDHYLYDKDGNYVWTRERSDEAWARVRYEADYLLFLGRYKALCLMVGLPGAGKSTYLRDGNFQNQEETLYLDATFVYPEWRQDFVEMACKHNIPIQALVVNTPLEVIQERNRQRPEGRAPSEEKLQEWHQALQERPPTKDEGFSLVVTISRP